MILVVGLLVFSVLAQSQPATPSPAEAKRKFAETIEKASAPTEAHKVLGALVGDFDQRILVSMGRGEPMKSHSVGKGQWIMGGRFVQFNSTSAPDEEVKGDRLVIFGYDPNVRKYTLWNIESMSLTATAASGDYDQASKTFTFDGEREEHSAKTPFRWTMKVQPDGSIAQEILMKFPNSSDYTPVVGVTYTRVNS
jgi:Protein of unknown function (DUF1579)